MSLCKLLINCNANGNDTSRYQPAQNSRSTKVQSEFYTMWPQVWLNKKKSSYTVKNDSA